MTTGAFARAAVMERLSHAKIRLPPMGVSTVAVIGSGLMGRGIAYVAAVGGFRTTLHDVSAEALGRALAQIRRDLDQGIERNSD
jgi:NADPH-dependent 2,4-dienoyl-CoA reductase/sulfur reductase-like enzyme